MTDPLGNNNITNAEKDCKIGMDHIRSSFNQPKSQMKDKVDLNGFEWLVSKGVLKMLNACSIFSIVLYQFVVEI